MADAYAMAYDDPGVIPFIVRFRSGRPSRGTSMFAHCLIEVRIACGYQNRFSELRISSTMIEYSKSPLRTEPLAHQHSIRLDDVAVLAPKSQAAYHERVPLQPG